MPELVIDVSQSVANYIKRKGFGEIFLRDNRARCEGIIKAFLKSSNEGQKDQVTAIASAAAQRMGISGKSLDDFKNEILRQIDPQTTRRQLAKLTKTGTQNNTMLKNLTKNVTSIYSAVSSIQAVAWLNVALSAASLAATVTSTVIICNKLDHIDKKLDRIEAKIDSVKRVQFVADIKQPCRSVIKRYKVITDKLSNHEIVTKDEMLTVINDCCDEMEKIYSLRFEYSTGTVVELLYDMMPVFTDLIIQFYQQFYDSTHGEYALHQDWMKIYDMLDSEEFRNQVQDYLILEENMGNIAVNEVLDCQHLATVGSKQKIEEVLGDLSICESAEDYRDIKQFSEQYALQQAKAIEADLVNQLGITEASQIIERAKTVYLYAS